MLKAVSVETGLKDIKAHLTSCGYQVVDMEKCISPVEAVIYQGPALEGSTAALRSAENTAIINATGLTAEQVVQQLEDRI